MSPTLLVLVPCVYDGAIYKAMYPSDPPGQRPSAMCGCSGYICYIGDREWCIVRDIGYPLASDKMFQMSLPGSGTEIGVIMLCVSQSMCACEWPQSPVNGLMCNTCHNVCACVLVLKGSPVSCCKAIHIFVPVWILCFCPYPQVRAVEQRRADESSAKLQEIAELRALWDAMASEQVRVGATQCGMCR